MSVSVLAPFGALLRQHRERAGLMQEELAERAGLSARGISDLERGLRTHPRRDTVRRLVEALGLAPAERDDFVGAARAAMLARHQAHDYAADSPTAAARHNLPRQRTSLIGREAAIAVVADLLATAPLLTLTGSGGVGKTRLALAVAELLRPAYPDGVWLVECAPLADPDLVPQAVARALGVYARSDEPLPTTLARALRPCQLLLLLDNCEHLIAACARLADALLRECPDLTILATSREALRVPGELPYRVSSLTLPGPDVAAPLEEVVEAGAVQLFLARARVSQPDFALNGTNAPLVARVCSQLDGIPLALELAAARLGALSLEEFARRLGNPFQLLTGGSRTALPRHQTLQATLDWSHRLLDEPERILFRRLSVFAGGWTLEAAEAVCADTGEVDGSLADVLAQLVAKSLVNYEEAVVGRGRYRLLEVVRQYAGERLAEAGEATVCPARHATTMLAFAESLDFWEHPITPAALAAFDAEPENLHQALDWLREHDPAAGLRLAAVLGQYWNIRGMLETARSWLADLLARVTTPSPARARVLFYLASWNADPEAAAAGFAAAITAARAVGDWRTEIRAVGILGRVSGYRGLHTEALTHGEAAVAAARAVGDPFLGVSLHYQSQGLGYQGDYARAEATAREAVAAFRQSDGTYGLAAALSHLGWCLTAAGAAEAAMVALEESLALHEDLRDQNNFIATLVARSDLALRSGDPADAIAWLAQAEGIATAAGRRDWDARMALVRGRAWWAQGERHSAAASWRYGLARAHEHGQTPVVTAGLEDIARLLADSDPARAARLLGAAAGLRTARGFGGTPVGVPGSDALVAGIRANLGMAFDDAWQAGTALTLELAIQEALA